MGLSIELLDESGGVQETVDDVSNLLRRLLPANDDQSSPMLASIDPYGDTVFNRIQMKRFLAEWRGLWGEAQSSEERAVVTAIEAMAQRCAEGVHLYVKFIGD